MVRRWHCVVAIFITWQILLTIYLVQLSWEGSTKDDAKRELLPKDLKDECCKEMSKECMACRNFQTVEEFCLENPGVFNCPEKIVPERCSLNPGTTQCIMISVALYPGLGITEFTATVMRNYHNISDEHIYLFPSAHVKYNSTSILKWYGKNAHILPTSEEKELHINTVKYFLKSNYDILFVLKSDMVFLHEWREFIEKKIFESGDVVSLYHSSILHNSTVDCEATKNELCVGNQTGSYGIAMTKLYAEKVLKNIEGISEVTSWKKVFGNELLYPPKSLAMHISQYEQNEKFCGTNEVPHRFNRCEFPNWVQNGVEFFFDRCTNADEHFNYDKKGLYPDLEKRYWSRPAVSFSLYGTKRRYNFLGLFNAARMSSVYPGWKMWVFYDKTVPKETLQGLCEYNARLINMTGSEFVNGMSWRFLVASDPVEIYAVRDIDSYLLARGKAAVDEWLKSGRKFHVMRDHKFHSSHAMNGGMWGGRHDAIPNMKKLLKERNLKGNYMQDMTFLKNVIWPIAKNSVWAHDSHSLGIFGEDHPFPLGLEDPRFFIGSVN